VTFVLGRAGTGKTRRCLDALLAALRIPTDSHRLLLLVPEQASFQMERALALHAPGGGYLRAAVLSFSRLARLVLAAGGAAPVELSPGARVLALRRILGDSRFSLRRFGSAGGTGGFVAELDRLIEHLLSENISPADLRAAAEKCEDDDLRQRTDELAAVFQAYVDWIGAGRVDPAARLAVLRERLAQCAWLREAQVWVDGFAGFTGQELATLISLAQVARELTITLLLDPSALAVERPGQPPDPLDLFRRTEATYQQLLRRLEQAGIGLRSPILLRPSPSPRFRESSELARLEAGLAQPAELGPGTPGDARVETAARIRILKCGTPREEVSEAAAFIRARVQDSGGTLHFRDFALVARDLQPYANLIADAFDEHEVPYFIDRRRPLGAHPLSRFARTLIDAVGQDLPVGDMTRLLRSGLLPLSREQAERLENTVVGCAVAGWDAWLRREWPFEDGADTRQDEELATSRQRIIAVLRRLLEADRKGSAGATWAPLLASVLAELGVPVRLEAWIATAQRGCEWEQAETHRLAWEGLNAALEAVAEILGGTRLSLREFGAALASVPDSQTLGLAPPTLDQVLIGEIERSRHPDVQFLWLLGFNEGSFPRRADDERILTSRDRAALRAAGLETLADRQSAAFDERLLAYIACTRPSRELVVSYAVAGTDSVPLQPSSFLEDVRQALPGLQDEQPQRAAPPASIAGFASLYLESQRGGPARLRARCGRLRGQLSMDRPAGHKLAWLLRGEVYANRAQALPGYRRNEADSPEVAWFGTFSELETQQRCPFQYFAQFGLGLDARRGPRPVSSELGESAHELLARVTRAALESGESVRKLTDEQWLRWLDEALRDFLEKQPDDLAQRRPQLAFLLGRLGEFVQDVVLVHAERWRRGLFEPVRVEQAFSPRGGEGVLPSLEIPSAAGVIQLRGKIDRVDRARSDNEDLYLVYDYKTTVERNTGKILTGKPLQVFAYLLALEQARSAGGGRCRLAGVLLAPLHPDTKALSPDYAASAPPEEQRLLLYRPRGCLDVAGAKALDPELEPGERSTVANLHLTKKGPYAKNCDVPAPDVLRAYLDLARATIAQAAGEIAAGDVTPAPLLENRSLPCRYCEFKSVCRFDPAYNQPRVAERALPTLAQMTGRAADDEGGAE